MYAAALVAAEAVRTAPADDPSPGGDLDGIEVVYIGEGSEVGWAGEPGLLMTWQQDGKRFGLLASLRRLAGQAGGLDALPFYLRLAIDEPHWPASNAGRHWFLELPTAPN